MVKKKLLDDELDGATMQDLFSMTSQTLFSVTCLHMHDPALNKLTVQRYTRINWVLDVFRCVLIQSASNMIVSLCMRLAVDHV